MMKVYLSGPINSPTKDGTDANIKIRRFDHLKAWLKRNYGMWEVTNPCEVGTKCLRPNCGEFDGHSWECWLKADLAVMLECDAILMLPDWEQSRGALLEHSVAEAVGMEVHHAVMDEEKGWLIHE